MASATTTKSTSRDRTAAPDPLRQLKVVLADDHPVVATSLCTLLENAGHRVLAAVGDTRSCVEAAIALRPDVVLIDLRMPGGGGLVASAQILAVHPAAKIVVISADAEPGRVRASLDAGCVGFVSKVANPAEIIEVLRAAATGELALDRRSATALVAASRRRETNVDRYGLTARELEVLALLADGLSNPVIAARLCLSRSTVAEVVSSVLRKLGVTDRTAAAVAAWKNGLVES
jgi:DNA-binding NarL/FixJ family response regulator